MTELLMIVGVFVAGGDAENSAGEDLGLSMTGAEGIAWIGDGLIDSADQIQPPVDFSQQH